MAENESSGVNTILIVIVLLVVLTVGFLLWRQARTDTNKAATPNVQINLPDGSKPNTTY